MGIKQNRNNRTYRFMGIIILLVISMTGCQSMNKQENSILPSATITVPEGNDTLTPTKEITETITPTLTEMPTPTLAVTPTTTPTPVEVSNEEKIKQRALEILTQMSLEEKVGQMFFARCPEVDAVQDVSQYHLGGYLLFGRDFKDFSKDEVIQHIKSYQEAATIPLWIGVDEEGGTVTRISRYSQFRDQVFPSPQELYAKGGFDAIKADTIEKSKLLKELGINVNFAPVSDISTNPVDFIYARSFGKGADETSTYVKTVVATMQEQGVNSVLKHFPGYGDNKDTHTGIAIDERPYEQFVANDFLPFEAGINEGAEFILISHNRVTSMDETTPASLSNNVHALLRNELNFDGITITDDLSMDAIGLFAKDSDAAVLAILAGNDMLCSTDYKEQFTSVIKAVKDGTITEERIEESVLRILKYKLKHQWF